MHSKKKINMPCVISIIILMFFTKGNYQDSVMTHLSYRSHINHRYAVTWVTANMKNPSENSTEIFFKMTLPKAAFISGLIMEVGGQNYTSHVDEVKAARKTYNRAKTHGRHAGIVEQSGSTEQKFVVSTNVEAKGKVIFYLKYEELLLRSKGKYTHITQIKPGVNPSQLDVSVHIKESEEIVGLKILASPLGSIIGEENKDNRSSSDGTNIHNVDPTSAVVRYHSQGPDGLYGELTLTYDVKRKNDAGEIQVSGGYFAHFFSPDGLEKMPAHTVFILDVSGSMSGHNIIQLKRSMMKIFKDLLPEDSFELLSFSSVINSLGTFIASNHNEMKIATEKISNLRADGGTNIDFALNQGFKKVSDRSQKSANQVVFLTDGEATAGETNRDNILKNVQEVNKKRIPLYSLSFGNNADYRFLSKLSFQNRGFVRKIPVDANTDEILRGFYQELGTPLMTDIDIKYPEDAVDQTSIVKNGWTTLQKGNEVIVAGQLIPGKNEVHPKVDGIIKSGSHQYKVPRLSKVMQHSEKENFIGHLWAYLTIQNLLKKADLTDIKEEKKELNSQALSLALKYNFVTKLTSLVVVRPGDLPVKGENTSLVTKEQPLEGVKSNDFVDNPYDYEFDRSYFDYDYDYDYDQMSGVPGSHNILHSYGYSGSIQSQSAGSINICLALLVLLFSMI